MEIVPGKLILNPDIAYRYFHSTKGIPYSNQNSFDVVKKDNAFRIFILGGSSAAGYPYTPNGDFGKYLQKKLPKGDGHPVMIIPGFMIGDAFTLSLRRLLGTLGYEAHPWDQGNNYGLRDETCHNLERRVAQIYRDSGRKVSLIGHSLGGAHRPCLKEAGLGLGIVALQARHGRGGDAPA